jgi:hypothetical protein
LTLSKLAEICESEEIRTALIREARAKVDKLRTEYDRVRNLRTRLERRGAPEAEIIAADRAVYTVRVELTRARRELLRST